MRVAVAVAIALQHPLPLRIREAKETVGTALQRSVRQTLLSKFILRGLITFVVRLVAEQRDLSKCYAQGCPKIYYTIQKQYTDR